MEVKVKERVHLQGEERDKCAEGTEKNTHTHTRPDKASRYMYNELKSFAKKPTVNTSVVLSKKEIYSRSKNPHYSSDYIQIPLCLAFACSRPPSNQVNVYFQGLTTSI